MESPPVIDAPPLAPSRPTTATAIAGCPTEPTTDGEGEGDGDTQETEDTEAILVGPPTQPVVPSAPPRHGAPDSGKWAVQLALLLVSTNLTLEKFHARKWKEILHLSKLIAAPRFRRVRLAGDDRAVYESCYRSFPHEMVTKPRLVGVLRAVFGVEDQVGFKSTLSPVEMELGRHLERMQYTYELSSDNVPMVNWRLLLVGLQMFQQPLVSMKEHLAWGFRIFSSAGFLDGLTDATTIQISDLALMLSQLMRNQACTRLVSERLRQAQVLQPTGALTPATIRLRMSSSRISYRRLQELLTLAPLQPLFTRVTEHTTVLDEMATPLYRQLVFKTRKTHSDRKKIERLRYFHRTKRVRRAYFVWHETARILKRTRALVVQAFKRIARVQRTFVFARLKQHAIQSWATTEIQRNVRGMIGRRVADDKWRLVQAVVKVQGAFRMRSHFGRFLQDLRRRNRAAVRVQRVYRGRHGRIVAKQRLLKNYYDEMEKLQHERRLFRQLVANEMAKRLTRLFRTVVTRSRERGARRDAEQRALVELEMLDKASEATRALRRYKHELTAQYDRLRDEYEYKKKRKLIDGVEKAKVVRLRRQRQWDAFKRARAETKERHKQDAGDAYNTLKARWEATIAERVQRKKLFVAQVVELDEPGEHKSLQKTLRALIADQEKQLHAKYKHSKVSVPKREVRERATVEVVQQQVEHERQQAESEWLHAEAEFLNDLEAKDEERMLHENAAERQRREKCAVVVQAAFRMFAARKLLKYEIRRCFVKEFDTATQLAMYRNAFADERPSPRKPYGLGPDEDLEYPDQWVLIHDDVVGHAFFFHPETITQSWEKPRECQCCDVCATTTTTAAVVVVVAFAAYWNAHDDSYLCHKCYDSRRAMAQSDERAATATFQADQYFPYDGSKRGGY